MLYRILTTAIFALIPALASAADPIPVSVQRLSEVLVDREVRAPASVISANRAIVTSEVSALIKEFAA
ncbi:MAG: hypothetical protein OEY72_05350, partial [Gammaproteobacteria bacterium]|nr:hypothetical protein [Gammaproteobacteria bacterium]